MYGGLANVTHRVTSRCYATPISGHINGRENVLTDSALKKLRRSQLLELLLAVTEENEALKRENKELNRRLNEKTITMQNAGSIAEASLRLSGVFEAAQSAADRYLSSIQAIAPAERKPS